MKRFFLSDTLYGLVLTLGFAFLYIGGGSFLETAELKFYDVRSRMRLNPEAGKEIAVIAIDDDSLAKIGRWPWPRSRIADILVALSTENAKPAVIGLDILFSEQEKNPGLLEIDRLKQKYAELVSLKQIKEASKNVVFTQELEDAKTRLDNDSKLASAVSRAGNVVLPMYFTVSQMGGKPQPMPAWIERFSMPVTSGAPEDQASPLEANQATIPLETLTSSASGVGHVNVYPDSDGTVRKDFLTLLYNDSFYPSFAVEIARNYLKLRPSDVSIAPGSNVTLSKSQVPVDPSCTMLVTFNGPDHTFRYYSFYDVLNGKVAPEAFKDKIVLIGPTAVGVGTLYVTPVAHNFPGVEVVANVVENLLHKRFLLRPGWAFQAELILIITMGLFMTLVLPRLKALMGAVLTLLLLAGLLGAGIFFFTQKSLWVKTMYPALLLAAGYTIITSKRFLVTEKKKELVEASAIETNKMLGLSFQGQGMLDLAFDKFRICPIDDPMKDLLYNLGLDFERKRQFNKAVAVYEHLATKDPAYKDIPKKIEMLKKAAEGAVFGGAIGKSKESTVIVEGSTMTPTLGRYEITKELGKGAMGIVYLGKDPKINRTVAIKTMRFEEDANEAVMKETKSRFFREAQAAGNLSHPNIVKIYDAGEEQDIAYIAMELLKGEDLKKWTDKNSLLPVEKLVEHIAKVADALEYAHSQGVIHRDIKPANIMLLEDGSVRVTDFGIARIQESSKTATGTVLGTPYYMSPEQISGKKVDGKSDIFSLGVTLYELLTGEKPWKGGESVGTLFFQIVNDPYADPLSIRPGIPPGLVPVIAKALKKNADERYQKAAEMAADLRSAISPGAKAPPPAQAAPKTSAPAEKKQPDTTAAAKTAGAIKPAAGPASTARLQPGAAKPGPAIPAGRPEGKNQPAPAAQTARVTPLSGMIQPPAGIERPPLAGLSSSPKKAGQAPPSVAKPAVSGVTGKTATPEAAVPLSVEPTSARTPLKETKSEIPRIQGLETTASGTIKPEPEKQPKSAVQNDREAAKPAGGSPVPDKSLPPQTETKQPAAAPETEKKAKEQAEPAQNTKSSDFEKTLPIIYPDEEQK